MMTMAALGARREVAWGVVGPRAGLAVAPLTPATVGCAAGNGHLQAVPRALGAGASDRPARAAHPS